MHGSCAPSARSSACTHLDLDLAFAADFLAVGAVAPALDEVARACVPRELDIGGDCGLLRDGEIGAGLGSRRRAPEGVRFPLVPFRSAWRQ